jgi:hypothetical protein
MVNATLFRKMGPELNPKLETWSSNSWSNSASGQNKEVITGADDNRDAPMGNAWEPKHQYIPDSDAIATHDGPTHQPY